MKCILLTTLIYCVFFTTNISAQYKNVFIPEWNEEQGTSFEKYNKNTVKNKYYMALEKLEIKDQLYRKHEVVDWEKQDLLDSRFFDPESGYCKDSESFIKHLKSKYPKEFAKDYKYEKFYE